MSEPGTSSESFESELRQFRPARPEGELAGRIAAVLARGGSQRWPASDRCLAGMMGLGLAAAVVIAAMLSLNWLDSRADSAMPVIARQNEVPSQMKQTRELLAELAAGRDPFAMEQGGRP